MARRILVVEDEHRTALATVSPAVEAIWRMEALPPFADPVEPASLRPGDTFAMHESSGDSLLGSAYYVPRQTDDGI